MLWPPDHDVDRSSREEAARKRAFGLYRDVLQAAEEAAVTRARLASRPHPPARTVHLRALLGRQTERRDAKYRALSALLDAKYPAPVVPPVDAIVRSASTCS